MKKITLFLVGLVFAGALWAQNVQVSGVVTDTEGQLLPGVTVVIKGTQTSAVTDVNGRYTINAPTDGELVFSFMGFSTQEIAVGDRTNIDVSMSDEAVRLVDVVIMAYGLQTKKSVTGAVSTLTADKISEQRVVSPVQALQGTAPGVQIVNTTGQPGVDPVIRIRGISSVSASSNPLIVLDGTPYSGTMSSINSADIESMTVLKDASSTALYGSRAANGVILVTTKLGKKGESTIALDVDYGISNRAVKDYPYLSTQEQFLTAWQAFYNEGVKLSDSNPGLYASDQLLTEFRYNPFNVAQPVKPDGTLTTNDLKWNENWEDLLTQVSNKFEANLSLTGGSEKSRYFMSFGYLKQDGYVITSDYERLNARINYSHDVRSWLEVGVKSQLSVSNQNYPTQSGSTTSSVIGAIRSISSIYPLYMRDQNGDLIYDENKEPIYDFGENIEGRTINVNRPIWQNSNLVASLNEDVLSYKRNLVTLSTFANVKIYDGLMFKTNFGTNRNFRYDSEYENPKYGLASNVSGRVTKRESNTYDWTWTNMLTYDKTFAEKHKISLMASMEATEYFYEHLEAQKTGYPFEGLTELASGAQSSFVNGYTLTSRIESYLGRAAYSFNEKYNLDVSVRWDGTTRFHTDNRWGFFPSVGASWVASEEDFLKNIDLISYLKVRGSYGQLGNNALVSYFPYLALFGTGYNDMPENPGVFMESLANNQLKWETVESYNIGVDFGLFEDRLTGSFDYFVKNSLDLLFDRALVPSGGVPTITENVGNMRNSGFEFNITGEIFKTKDFLWEANFNGTFLKNEITKLPQEKMINGQFQREVGKSIYEFFMPTWAGVDPADGAAMWYKDVEDEQGNVIDRTTTKELTDATDYYQGSAIPKFMGGFSTRLEYLGFDLSLLFNFQMGGKVLDTDYQGLMGGFTGTLGGNAHTDILKAWKKPGDVTDVPKLERGNLNPYQRSTRWLYSSDYLRLRNVTLGYNFKIPSNKYIQSARVYVMLDNYFSLVAGKAGRDPEVALNGTTDGSSSALKTFAFGVNLKF